MQLLLIFFHFNFFSFIIISIIITLLQLLQLLQLLLSLVVNSSSTSRSIIIIFVTITSSCIIKIPISLIISTSIFELFTFPFVLNQYTPPRFFLRDHNGNKNSKLFCVAPATTLPQLLQFSILMNLYFVHVINIRFICDGEIYLLTYSLPYLHVSSYQTISIIAFQKMGLTTN